MVASEYTVSEINLLKDLEQLSLELQIAQSGLTVVIAQLNAQRADLDPDLACVLEHHVSSRLFKQIDLVDDLVESLRPRPSNLFEAAA